MLHFKVMLVLGHAISLSPVKILKSICKGAVTEEVKEYDDSSLSKLISYIT